MKWFLFFVVLISLHKYAYGEKITMYVNVNDTVDLKVEKEPKQNIISCQVQFYSDTGVLPENFTLVQRKIWLFYSYEHLQMEYFELLDYFNSCSFSISPFPSKFYGHWIVNTTTDIGEEQVAVYRYKYQKFYLKASPKENISYSKDDHFEYNIDTEKNYTTNMYGVHNNPISLRPKKVFGQVKKCQAIYYHDYHKLKNTTEPNFHNLNKTVYEIFPNTSDGMIFTGNNRSCQFKISLKKFPFQNMEVGKYGWIHPLYERWEIITYYEDHQLTNRTFHQIDTFNIYMIVGGQLDYSISKNEIKGPAYIKIEKLDTVTNSTVSEFKCQFDAGDRQTELIKFPVYNNSMTSQDNFYRRIDYKNDYGLFFIAKYYGNYECILERKNKTFKTYNFKTISSRYSKQIFDYLSLALWLQGCSSKMLAIKGTMFMFWNYVQTTIDKKNLRVFIEMPNGTSIGTNFHNSSISTDQLKAYSVDYNTMLKRKDLYVNLSIIDNGIWKLHYHNILSKDPEYPIFTIPYFVTTWDSTHVKVVVDMTTENPQIFIYNIQKNPKSCLFMSTDGTVIEESKPKVYEKKIKKACYRLTDDIDSLSECGFEINEPSDSDYDMKMFSIDYENFTISRTIILQNNFRGIKKYDRISYKHRKDAYFLKNGDDFLVNCSDNRPLLFCRIQTPIEEVTHITDKDTLEAGNCSMLVKNANILEHNGTWKCELAFNESNIGSTIIDYYFSVEVRNFYVRSHIEYINETNQEKNETIIKKAVIIHCEISNYLKRYKNDLIEGHRIDYCLWDHPNGTIIFENSNEYTLKTTTLFSCDLTIHNLNQKNFGKWSCNPKFELLIDLSVRDTIDLVELPVMQRFKNYAITPELKPNITLYDDYHRIASIGPGLDCHISPAVEAHMISCKWTKINGNNNNFTADNPDGKHYVPQKNNSVCELRFIYLEESGDKLDYGKWKCCVNIVDSVEPTICQDIELPNKVDHPLKEGIGIYIFILIAIIFLLAVICSCCYFIIRKFKEKLEKKRKKKQRQSRRSRSSRRRRRARSASQQNQARSSSHPRQPNSSLPSSQQDAQSSRIISARIRAEPNIYV